MFYFLKNLTHCYLKELFKTGYFIDTAVQFSVELFVYLIHCLMFTFSNHYIIRFVFNLT